MVNFRVKKNLQERPLTALALLVRTNFRKINFVAAIDYKNIRNFPDLRYNVPMLMMQCICDGSWPLSTVYIRAYNKTKKINNLK